MRPALGLNHGTDDDTKRRKRPIIGAPYELLGRNGPKISSHAKLYIQTQSRSKWSIDWLYTEYKTIMDFQKWR